MQVAVDRPDWIQALEAAVQANSQKTIAERLGVSRSAISLMLSGTYKASTTRMEERVRGALMAETVHCPVLGELGKDQCLEEQGMGYYPSPIRTALSRACKTCPNASRALVS